MNSHGKMPLKRSTIALYFLNLSYFVFLRNTIVILNDYNFILVKLITYLQNFAYSGNTEAGQFMQINSTDCDFDTIVTYLLLCRSLGERTTEIRCYSNYYE